MNGLDRFRWRIALRLFAPLVVSCAIGCGGRVNLGGASSGSSTEPDGGASSDGAPGANTSVTTILGFNEDVGFCHDLAADDTYLYLLTNGRAGPSVHRCRKADCAASIVRVAGPFCQSCTYHRIEIVGGHLGLVHADAQGGHIDTCTLPACNDLREVVGALPSIDAVAFATDRVYFGINADRSIYDCSFPTCAEGPRAFAPRPISSGDLATSSDWVYWPDHLGEIKRKRKDGTSGMESLVLGATLGRAFDGGTDSMAEDRRAGGIAVEGPWLYALSARFGESDADSCGAKYNQCAISRWPNDALGGAREVVLKSNFAINARGGATPYSRSGFRVFDGELVFSTNETYTCNAADCMATLRSLGLAPDPTRMASDGDYLYWCTRTPDPTFGMVQRVGRIRR